MAGLASTHMTRTQATAAATSPPSYARFCDDKLRNSERNHRQTLTHGLSAFKKIMQTKLPADPPSYEVWYEYVTGRTPALNRAIDDIVLLNQVVSADDLSKLHGRFFSFGRVADRLDTVSDNMDEAVAAALTLVDAAAWSIDCYQIDLARAVEGLSDAHDQAALRAIIESLASATAEMETKNRSLCASLNTSTQEIADLQANLAIIRAESLMDSLTAVANRKHFDKMLESAVAQYGRDVQPFSLIMCDIDHFKHFNDTFGHQTGDRVLTLVGAALKQTVRGQDTPARYGGEEFAVILPSTSLSQASVVGENIRKAIAKNELVKRSSGKSLGRVTASVGVAEIQSADSAQSLIERADQCLYEAKRRGRDCVVSERDF